MKRARDFEDLDAIDTELDRLRNLVEDAYDEGWSNGRDFEKSTPEDYSLNWNNSKAKQNLNK